MCEIDPAMFCFHNSDKLSGIVCCHVDDFLHADDENSEKIMVSLRKRQETLNKGILITLVSE